MTLETAAEPNTSAPQNAGSTVENVYVRRKVTVLAVHEHEVQDISFMNFLTTACFSIASALIGYAVGIGTNAAFADRMTPAANGAVRVGVPICIFAAIVFIGLGVIAFFRRSSTLADIRKQTTAMKA